MKNFVKSDKCHVKSDKCYVKSDKCHVKSNRISQHISYLALSYIAIVLCLLLNSFYVFAEDSDDKIVINGEESNSANVSVNITIEASGSSDMYHELVIDGERIADDIDFEVYYNDTKLDAIYRAIKGIIDLKGLPFGKFTFKGRYREHDLLFDIILNNEYKQNSGTLKAIDIGGLVGIFSVPDKEYLSHRCIWFYIAMTLIAIDILYILYRVLYKRGIKRAEEDYDFISENEQTWG